MAFAIPPWFQISRARNPANKDEIFRGDRKNLYSKNPVKIFFFLFCTEWFCAIATPENRHRPGKAEPKKVLAPGN